MTLVRLYFIKHDGNEVEVTAECGASILQIAQENGLEIEGACEGNMACSTCHVIVDKEFYDLLPEASDEEEEMLDLASGLRATSRLGCQLLVTSELDGMKLILPKESRNMIGF
ncbi:ferredoxin family 2Fe-2S iron-sulfur cluster binding protein [Kordiimonas pumila]|uniref:Ferredoxin family 2Fe-2S iron-sulfur cluster binding protein n=1 Tax=Kordiimonas pumila TaxID=2161677 RepID=A0ABV7D1U3_9PROT|nr:ferredoxin family 2Fe-2S iron-sulfur cluster binding protein [Kordiimonas pumila]